MWETKEIFSAEQHLFSLYLTLNRQFNCLPPPTLALNIGLLFSRKKFFMGGKLFLVNLWGIVLYGHHLKWRLVIDRRKSLCDRQKFLSKGHRDKFF